MADETTMSLDAITLAGREEETAELEFELRPALIDETVSEQASDESEHLAAKDNKDERDYPAGVLQICVVRAEERRDREPQPSPAPTIKQ